MIEVKGRAQTHLQVIVQTLWHHEEELQMPCTTLMQLPQD